MKVCHVVRRYGPVGGMESYVYYLTRALADLKIDIVILCEEDLSAAGHPPNVKVHAIGVAPMRRPRWRAMEWFRDRVQPLVARLKRDGYLIHSHERIRGHHITTQHGPLMTGSTGILMPLFSKRIRKWLEFERDELSCQLVLPVSRVLMSMIQAQFPDLRFGPIVWPGMLGNSIDEMHHHSDKKHTFLFVGRDFKRKGLNQAIDIVESIRKTFPSAELDVYGVSTNEVPRHMKKGFVKYFGWSNSIPYRQYKILLHPATIEPFGMCVTEALAQGLTCFVSGKTGALEVKAMIPELPLHQLAAMQDVNENASRILRVLRSLSDDIQNSFVGSVIPWSWEHLALIHSTQIYPHVIIDSK